MESIRNSTHGCRSYMGTCYYGTLFEHIFTCFPVGNKPFVYILQAYPRPVQWVNSPGDTALIVASGVGAALGMHAHKQPQLDAIDCQHCLEYPALNSAIWAIPKMLTGFFLILLTRAVFKSLMAPLCLWMAGPLPPKKKESSTSSETIQAVRCESVEPVENKSVNGKVEETAVDHEEFFRQNPLSRYEVEIPLKFLTYIPVGFNTFCVIPLLFEFLGV
eukprot:gb/GECG01016629.1/.p1 GENE.gb/GECG01016629.1/~~gb/GECG01016629.1/.p1  ORF type:complete len:218 (+),score=10.94 gb/GECG01016629.1/:1-654(+)